MKCSNCNQVGHNKRSCKVTTKIPNQFEQVNASFVDTPKELVHNERVKKLKEHLFLSKVKHADEIMKMHTLKDAHIYCVIHNVSTQQYGALLEKYIRTKFNYVKNNASDCIGDCSKDGNNTEIKVSLGGSDHTKFNFVQIRTSHACETFIFTAYHVCKDCVDGEGKLFIFKVPKAELKMILVKWGGYAHGTTKEHGKITFESLSDETNHKEYALRPKMNDKCWYALMSYCVSEYDI